MKNLHPRYPMPVSNHPTVLQYVIATALLFLMPGFSSAQSKRIDGNGKITTSVRTLSEFYAIHIDDYCNVDITCGQMAKLEISIDENLLPRLKTQVRSGVLHIEADGWIEATQLQLKIGVPFLTKLHNGAWGKIVVNNIDTHNFELDAEVGDVTLQGKVESLTITAGSGRIDASGLDARDVAIEHRSHAATKVFVREKLSVNLRDGDVVYAGTPTTIDQILTDGATLKNLNDVVDTPGVSPKFVVVNLRNNSTRKQSLEIKGPKGNRFSYGIAIGPLGNRKEKLPIETRILNNKGETLVTISATDDGKTLNLF